MLGTTRQRLALILWPRREDKHRAAAADFGRLGGASVASYQLIAARRRSGDGGNALAAPVPPGEEGRGAGTHCRAGQRVVLTDRHRSLAAGYPHTQRLH